MPVLACLGHQSLQGTAGNPLQRLLSHVRRTKLEAGNSQAIALLVTEVGHEALGNQHVEHAVQGRTGNLRLASDARSRQRRRMAGEQLQDRERVARCRGLSHIWESTRSTRSLRGVGAYQYSSAG